MRLFDLNALGHRLRNDLRGAVDGPFPAQLHSGSRPDLSACHLGVRDADDVRISGVEARAAFTAIALPGSVRTAPRAGNRDDLFPFHSTNLERGNRAEECGS